MVCMNLYHVYVCMYRMTNGKLEVRIFFIDGWSNTLDAHFTELSFEAPRTDRNGSGVLAIRW